MCSLADELPAYILVMLDNKRQWSDISQELEVFMVESTEPFVEWLKKEIDCEWPCRQSGALFCTLRRVSCMIVNTYMCMFEHFAMIKGCIGFTRCSHSLPLYLCNT